MALPACSGFDRLAVEDEAPEEDRAGVPCKTGLAHFNACEHYSGGQVRTRAIPCVLEALARARDDRFHLEEVSDLRPQGAIRKTFMLVCPPSHARPAATGCQPAACLHLGPRGDQLQRWAPRRGQATLRTNRYSFEIFVKSYCWFRAANPPCNASSTHPGAARRSATATAVSTMRGASHLANNPDKVGNLANTSLQSLH